MVTTADTGSQGRQLAAVLFLPTGRFCVLQVEARELTGVSTKEDITLEPQDSESPGPMVGDRGQSSRQSE